jgi:flagellar basal-body rod modification protein FlgD
MTTLTATSAQTLVGNPASQAQTATSKLAADFDSFLKLLTAQLQFQDPLEPMDNNQFTQQLVSFTGVEQSINTNKNLETLIANTQANNLSASLGYLGRDVEVNSATQTLGDEGGLTWRVNLPTASDKVKAEVVDRNGVVVFDLSGRLEAGDSSFLWDGLNRNGNRALPGDYTLRIDAKTASDAAITAGISYSGLVNSINVADGTALLTVGNTLVSSGQIKRLSVASPPPTTPPAAPAPAPAPSPTTPS